MKLKVSVAFLLLAISQPGWAQQKIAVQHWQYDSVTQGVRITVANDSQKEVTSYNMTVRITHNDGSTSQVEVTRELLPRVISVERIDGLRKQIGNGGIPPGATYEDFVGDPGNVSNVEATVDAVIYYDSTADVKNDRAFKRMIADRQGIVLAMQKATEILQRTKYPLAAVSELGREAKALHGQNLAPDDPLASVATHLEAIQQEVIQEANVKITLENQQRSIHVAQAHATVRRNGGAQ
jgi:hypothetical protein